MLPTTFFQPATAAHATPGASTLGASTLGELLARSQDEFYGSLQRTRNGVVQPEGRGLLHGEPGELTDSYPRVTIRNFTDKTDLASRPAL